MGGGGVAVELEQAQPKTKRVFASETQAMQHPGKALQDLEKGLGHHHDGSAPAGRGAEGRGGGGGVEAHWHTKHRSEATPS
jgi:hypothetical protein